MDDPHLFDSDDEVMPTPKRRGSQNQKPKPKEDSPDEESETSEEDEEENEEVEDLDEEESEKKSTDESVVPEEEELEDDVEEEVEDLNTSKSKLFTPDDLDELLLMTPKVALRPMRRSIIHRLISEDVSPNKEASDDEEEPNREDDESKERPEQKEINENGIVTDDTEDKLPVKNGNHAESLVNLVNGHCSENELGDHDEQKVEINGKAAKNNSDDQEVATIVDVTNKILKQDIILDKVMQNGGDHSDTNGVVLTNGIGSIQDDGDKTAAERNNAAAELDATSSVPVLT